MKTVEKELISNKELCWLIFLDEYGVGDGIVKVLKHNDYEVICVKAGETFRTIEEDDYAINPIIRTDYSVLLKKLIELKKIPDRIIYLWSITPGQATSADADFLDYRNTDFYSLL